MVTLLITSRAAVTLPRNIWDGMQHNINPVGAAVIILLTAVAMLIHLAIAYRPRTRA